MSIIYQTPMTVTGGSLHMPVFNPDITPFRRGSLFHYESGCIDAPDWLPSGATQKLAVRKDIYPFPSMVLREYVF